MHHLTINLWTLLNKHIALFAVTLILSILTGCSNQPYSQPKASSYPQPSYSIPTTPNGSNQGLKQQVRDTALAQLGTRYRYGGDHPNAGFDCSGLVLYSYQQHGINLPRTTQAQYSNSKPITLEQAQPGDLVFFDLGSNKPQHVAIYLGDGQFVHAPSSGKRVETNSLNHIYWSKHLLSIRRIY